MHLIVGLGNPDPQYQSTRHNIGASFLDLLAKKITAEFVEDKKLLGLVATGKLGKVAVTLLKPTTYVNKSGEAVKAAKLKLKVKNDQVLILHDDLDVPFGKVKYAPASGAGGHKGIRSIQLQLKTEAIPRIKIGVANSKLKLARSQRSDEKRIALIGDFVLGKFTPAEKEKLRAIWKEVLVRLEQNIK